MSIISVDQRADLHFEPFRPALQGRFLARFHQAAKELVTSDQQAQDRIVQTEVMWAEDAGSNRRQQDMYKAVWLLLRDLMRVGWIPGWNVKTTTFEVATPVSNNRPLNQVEIKQHKEMRRAMMAHERRAKLYEAREFIRRMESPPQGLPVSMLIADGQRIAARLEEIARIKDKLTRDNALRIAVRPYLQLVEDGLRCQFTGQLLGEIWRYFRLTWASPPYSTPGRSMFYLVRDAAQPYHPVIGIASLENAPIFIGVRDKYLGWTAESFVDQFLTEDVNANIEGSSSAHARYALDHLLKRIDTAVGEISAAGLCSVEELRHPTPELVKRLSHFAAQFAEERRAALRRWANYLESGATLDEEESLERSEYGNISTEAYELLFKKKRAGELARLLGARLEIDQLLARRNFADEWLRWTGTERGKNAIRNGLLASKNRHVGTSILELNVCGAIPPYNSLLGGKLTALLMCSPQIVHDYRMRYGNSRSEIASQLKGEDVIRPAELVYIGTTSLYTAGASQYNRLKLPAGLLRSDAPAVEFRLLGETLGYGTAHISEVTTAALETTSNEEYLQVNHVMGEGVSPKMRIIRSGLNSIFRVGQRSLSDRMAQHQMQRLVYGVWLAENGRAYMNGESNHPQYVWEDSIDPFDGTERIVDYWRTRWLDSRIQHGPALTATAEFLPLSYLVSNALEDLPDMDWAYALAKSKREQSIVVQAKSESVYQLDPGERKRQLIRDLYLGTSGMAENIPADDLRYLHAPTRLDDAIRQHIAAGRSVVLTGNPGDGKTHILLKMAHEIEAMNAFVEQDASQVRNEEVIQRWRSAQAAKRPYFIAVNESVLFKLASTYRDFPPIQSAWRQVSQAIQYRPIGDTSTPTTSDTSLGEVVVLDLSHRNTLSSDLVDAVIMKLTDASMLSRCSMCPVDGCDLVHNRRLLQSPQVRQRLQFIFERITRRGIHVTMRGLQGFASYLLFAERDCTRMLQQSDEARLALPQLPFIGTGKLFDAARRTFDPALTCHPVFDDHIVNNTLHPEDWLLPEMAYGGSLDANALDQFEQRKRSFYFFHREGESLLKLASDEDDAFAEFMAETNQRTALRSILTKLTAFFSRRPEQDVLPVWQSHRYDHSAQRILYAVQERRRSEFELLRPVLTPVMAEAFDLADDHRLLRLRDNHLASLRIDFQLFQLLHRAVRGLPVLFLQPDLARRIWKFIEQLPNAHMKMESEGKAKILDSVTGDLTVVTVDYETGTYISIAEG